MSTAFGTIIGLAILAAIAYWAVRRSRRNAQLNNQPPVVSQGRESKDERD